MSRSDRNIVITLSDGEIVRKIARVLFWALGVLLAVGRQMPLSHTKPVHDVLTTGITLPTSSYVVNKWDTGRRRPGVRTENWELLTDLDGRLR